MSNQYHFEQGSSLRESPVDQAVRFFTRDWETTNDQIDSFSDPLDPLEGKIIAQMPDLGECRTISEVRRSQQQQSGNWLNRIYSGLTLISYFPKWIRQVLPSILPSIKFRNFQFSFIRQRKFYSNLIILCLVILIIGGGVLIYKSNKKKWKEVAHRDNDQNIVQKVETPEATPTPAENPTPSPATPPTEKPTTPPSAIPSTEKPATPPSATPSTEKPATPPPATPSTEKPATPPPATPVPATTVAVISPKVSEVKKKDQNNVNSPWERSTTDNYSPWTINTQSRLEAAAVSEAAEVSANSVNAVQPPTNPSVPLVPMTPLAPNQPEIPANTTANNYNNNYANTNNIVNPVNNTVPIANNAVPVVNNVSSAVVNNTVPPVNNPVNNIVPNNIAYVANNVVNNTVPSIPVTQPGLPHSPNPNGVVTVYSQHNIPVSQDYMTTYERTNFPPVPAPVQPTSPIYPPQTYNGQPGQYQQGQNQPGQYQQGQYQPGQYQQGQYQPGQYQQIVPPPYQGTPTVNNITMPVPMHGVAPQPQPIPITGAAPIPIQPVAPVQGTASLPIPQEIIPSPTIPVGMVPPAGTMSMSQPIPTQVIASIPPTYHSPPAYSYPVPSTSVPIAPSYYPPAVTAPYYQQGNTNTSVPYRRLY